MSADGWWNSSCEAFCFQQISFCCLKSNLPLPTLGILLLQSLCLLCEQWETLSLAMIYKPRWVDDLKFVAWMIHQAHLTNTFHE